MNINFCHLICLFATFVSLHEEVEARDVVGQVQLNKDSCWDVGYVDWLNSPGECQFHCSLRQNCNSWGYTHGGIRRCHLCTWTYPRTTVQCGSTSPPCKTWGRREAGIDAVTVLNDGIQAASQVCDGTLTGTNASTVATELNVIINAYADGNFNADNDFINNLPTAADIAAETLKNETKACNNDYTGPQHTCKYGSLIFHQLRALLLNVDNGNANRAFPKKFDKLRKNLLNDYGIFLADNRWMNKFTIKKLSTFYSQLPSFMSVEGILYDAIYATQTVKDAWKCNGNFPGALGSSNRGFNVFKTQVGQAWEQAFPGDTPAKPSAFDLQLTVTRHEVAHQFDRIIYNRASANNDSRLKQMKLMLTQASAGNDNNWLRSQVGDAYFQRAPQEIIASHIGNQYLASTSSQLRLAAARLTKASEWVPWTYATVTEGDATLTRANKGCSSQTKNLGSHNSAQECVNAAMNDASCSYEIMYSSAYPTWGCRCCKEADDMSCPSEDALYNSHNLWDIYQFRNSDNDPTCFGTGVPLSWFLFNVDLFTPVSSQISTIYENEENGEVIPVEVLITRDAGTDGITSLDIPFCGLITFGYDTDGIVNSVSGNAKSCTFSCQDDTNFSIDVRGDDKFCDWVGLKPKTRCKKIGKDGRTASKVCLASCNMCS